MLKLTGLGVFKVADFSSFSLGCKHESNQRRISLVGLGSGWCVQGVRLLQCPQMYSFTMPADVFELAAVRS